MKIGILGGSFHPIHNGHLEMARSARDALQLDTVLLMVDRIPPHKELAQGADSQQRFSWLAKMNRALWPPTGS